MDDLNEMIERFIEVLKRESPGRKCFDEDDIRSAFVKLFENTEEDAHGSVDRCVGVR